MQDGSASARFAITIKNGNHVISISPCTMRDDSSMEFSQGTEQGLVKLRFDLSGGYVSIVLSSIEDEQTLAKWRGPLPLVDGQWHVVRSKSAQANGHRVCRVRRFKLLKG